MLIISITDMNELISLNHGSGGRIANDLIRNLFVSKFKMKLPLTDSALIAKTNSSLTFTTDSYIVNPIFFPGGDIGKLAVCGTINDLAVSGATPMYISVSFIIEEGFPLNDLVRIVDSMADEAQKANVKIVTGDTKVVEKGKCDKIFISTSGIGFLNSKFENISVAADVKPGDKILLNGPLANHAVAILGARENLRFEPEILSDCASLNDMIQTVLRRCDEVHFMRDLTRGGFATTLNELADIVKMGIEVEEKNILVEEPVQGLCEILGFDPLYLANEGKIIIVIGKNNYKDVLNILHDHPLGKQSRVVGEIVNDHPLEVVLNTNAGGKRMLDMLSGLQLPRIC